MIVISGILLLIAVVFLVIGLFSALAWVYASIAVSVLSFVFLLVGVRQRRDIAPAGAAAPAAPRGALPTEAATADVTLVPAGGRRPTPAPVAAAVLADVEKAAPARVPSRPRSAAAAPARPAARPRATGSAASNRLRGSGTRPRAVLPARLADSGAAKKAVAKKAPAKAAAKKAAPAKAAAKKAAPAKAAAKKAAPAKKAPAKTVAKKAAPAKKTAAKKAPAKKATR